ncbi:MAG: beta-lactamase family protein [Chitinophagaceae bacterium]|nr:beta-lactamase family protein [Chitinophagaceae bacterium]
MKNNLSGVSPVFILTNVYCRLSLFRNPFFWLVSFLLFMASCRNHGHAGKKKDDSLDVYPPTPSVLKKEDFRNYFRRLNLLFDTLLFQQSFNGGILIAKDGEVIYETYRGYADLRKKDTILPTTPFHIASTTKTFTSAAILKMVHEKKLSLDDTLQKFFPHFPYHGITVRHLLNHRSGLPEYLYFIRRKNKKIQIDEDWMTNESVLNELISRRPPPEAIPGKKHFYSNTNFVLLALIIEKISGKKFPDFIHENIFQPLGMNHSFVFVQADTARVIPSFQAKGTLWPYDIFDGTYGDKNIYSTPRDLLLWDKALYKGNILPQSWLDSAYYGYDMEDSIHHYGLGWRLQFLPNGKKVKYHFGRWHGFNTAFARLTDEKVTIIITGNRFNKNIYTAAQLAYDIFGDYRQEQYMQQPVKDSLSEKSVPSSVKGKPKKRKKKNI